MRRALAARHEPPRALPLRLLPAPFRAPVGVPQLRGSLDDRAHVGHRERHLPQLRRLDARGHLTAVTTTRTASFDPSPRRRTRGPEGVPLGGPALDWNAVQNRV